VGAHARRPLAAGAKYPERMRVGKLVAATGVASAALALAVLVAAAPATRSAARAAPRPAPVAVLAAGCPAPGRLVRPLAGDRPDAARVAAAFVRAWYAGEVHTAVRLADPSFASEAVRLAGGPRRPELPFTVQRIAPLGHTAEALDVARRCGPRLLPAVWSADVRRADAAVGAHLLLVRRRAGWRVWAIR
jgi:hypothetical protein